MYSKTKPLLRLFNFKYPSRHLYLKSQQSAVFRLLESKYTKEDLNNENVKTSQERMEEITEIWQRFREGGNAKSKHRHTQVHKKLLIRDRIKRLLDDDSDFFEMGLLAGYDMDYGDVPSAGYICGIGKVHGIQCLITGSDATIKGGTFFPITVTKTLRIQEIAMKNRIPLINLVDSGGAFLPLQADIFPDKNHGGRTFYNQAILSSKGIPQICIVCGSCTAGAAYAPSMCEEAIIVDKMGSIFLAGPPLVKAAMGEEVTAEELGGARMHCTVSGGTDMFASNEDEALTECRDIVASLNITPIQHKKAEKPLYDTQELIDFSYLPSWSREESLEVISRIVDGSAFREFKKLYGDNLITGYAHIQGHLVGLLLHRSPLSSKDALKGCHFVQTCSNRAIPLVFLHAASTMTDCCDDVSLLRDRSKLAAAVSTVPVPKIAVTMLGCYGDQNIYMCGPGFSPNFHFMWPLSSYSQFPMTHNDSVEKLSALHAAAHMITDDIIMPQNTYKVIGDCLNVISQKVNYTPVEHPVYRM